MELLSTSSARLLLARLLRPFCPHRGLVTPQLQSTPIAAMMNALLLTAVATTVAMMKWCLVAETVMCMLRH